MLERFGELPSVENLQCFLAAAQHLNFRRAAAEMYLTPTAFGQRIKQLEETLGQQLFHRTTRKVELSVAGRALVEPARSVVHRARQCIEVLYQEEAPASFVLGTRFELGLSWLVPVLIKLREAYPQWSVELYFGSGPDILHKLESGHVDCIVTSAPVAHSEWESEFLHPESYVFVCERERYERQPIVSAQDVREHALIDIDKSLPLTRYLTSISAPLDFGEVVLCGTGGAVHQFVLAGEGIAVLPEYMVRKDLEEGRVVNIFPDLELLSDSFRLLYREDGPLTSVFRRLAAWLREQPLQ